MLTISTFQSLCYTIAHCESLSLVVYNRYIFLHLLDCENLYEKHINIFVVVL